MLKKAQKKLITQKQAGAELAADRAHVRRLVKQLEARGDKAVIHALRGKPSNRKLSEPSAREDSGDSVASPVQRFRADGSQRGIGQQARHPDRARSPATVADSSRSLASPEAMAAALELSRRIGARDTSEHDWLEGRGDKLYLIAMIDDATSESTARFAIHDSSDENMRLLRDYLEKNGRPVGFYTDKASLFQTAPKVARGQKHWPKTNASRYRLPRLDALCRSCK